MGSSNFHIGRFGCGVSVINSFLVFSVVVFLRFQYVPFALGNFIV